LKPLAILTPSITKSEQCWEHMRSAMATAPCDVFVYTQYTDRPGYQNLIPPDNLLIGPNVGFGRAINLLWKAFPGYQYYMWGSDDVFFEDNQWYEKLVERMQLHNDKAIVWPDDSLTGHAPASSLARFALTSGLVLYKLGYFGLPGLFHWHIDDVMTALSHRLNGDGFVPEAKVFHKHNPAPMPEWWRSQDDTNRYNQWREWEVERDLDRINS